MTPLRTLLLLATLTLAHTFLLPLSAQETERVHTTDTITTETHTPDADTLTIDTTRLLAIPGKIIKQQRYGRDLSGFKPDPIRSTWLALVLPGAGQIYNRKYWKLPLVYGGFLGCTYAFTWNQQMYSDYSQAYLDIMDTNPETHSYTEFLPPNFNMEGREEHFKEVFNADTFEMYKNWAYVTSLMGSCSLLTEELRDLGGGFRRAISGIAAVSSPEKFAYQLASGQYSEPVGLYYGEKYFGEEAKKDITEIVKQIVATYQKRIANNDILEQATKDKAILKLSKMGLKLAYPDRVEEIYTKLVFDESKSLFDIVSSLRKIRMEENFAKLNKEVDRTHWAMPGHMVNACYDPFVNDITFPAAILQPPFYSIHQTRSENLGGIGAVIGHEISHAFDSNGAKCDELGNLNNWWTKADERKFNKKVGAMIKQFDGIELPWGVCNGKFTVSENIADNGGMAVTLDIMSHSENVSFEEYFSNWARVWCQKAKPEYQALLLQVDVHGPCYLRANMPPRNFPEWYAAFNVKKSDGMYLAPSKRVVIW